MKTYRERAIVLRTFKLGEADRILVLLSRGCGLIRAVAKGVRKTTSKFGARLEPFTVVDLQLHQGRNLDTVVQAEMIASYGAVFARNYEMYAAAHVMVEVTERLTMDEEYTSAYFQLLYGALNALASGDRQWDLIAGSYLLRALALSGWAPSCDTCAVCGAASDLEFFSNELGGAICVNCAGPGCHLIDNSDLRLMSALVQVHWPQALELSVRARSALPIISDFAQYHVERNLKSVPIMERGVDE